MRLKETVIVLVMLSGLSLGRFPVMEGRGSSYFEIAHEETGCTYRILAEYNDSFQNFQLTHKTISNGQDCPSVKIRSAQTLLSSAKLSDLCVETNQNIKGSQDSKSWLCLFNLTFTFSNEAKIDYPFALNITTTNNYVYLKLSSSFVKGSGTLEDHISTQASWNDVSLRAIQFWAPVKGGREKVFRTESYIGHDNILRQDLVDFSYTYLIFSDGVNQIVYEIPTSIIGVDGTHYHYLNTTDQIDPQRRLKRDAYWDVTSVLVKDREVLVKKIQTWISNEQIEENKSEASPFVVLYLLLLSAAICFFVCLCRRSRQTCRSMRMKSNHQDQIYVNMTPIHPFDQPPMTKYNNILRDPPEAPKTVGFLKLHHHS
eukprot:TRINITY_DN3253_c0_g1_i9.p1 TRINITY_DN3253_c0_g1~~TRINITY_DN3253_c0_g1_i9.p1  ORF type:complete len:371 (-),score=25.46 TRINITY_DN3253_c0_g1_i9:163-1275(-)